MKKYILIFMLLLGYSIANEVLVWQPYYNQSTGLTALQNNSAVITRVGLQFWLVNSNATLTDNSGGTTSQFVSYAHSKGIKVFATIYNSDTGWDWQAVRMAISPATRTTFINNILSAMSNAQADGVDLDIEGLYDFQVDQLGRYMYSQFVGQLSDSLKARGKLLTICSYPYHWNGPNDSEWEDWRYRVDAINIMGYENTSVQGVGWAAYSDRLRQGMINSFSAGRLVMGVPSSMASWSGLSADQQIAGAGALGLSIGVWDLPTMATWVTPAITSALAGVKARTRAGDLSTPALDSAMIANRQWLTDTLAWWPTSDSYGTTSNSDSLLVTQNSVHMMHFVSTVVPSTPDSIAWTSLWLYTSDTGGSISHDLSKFPGIAISYRSTHPIALHLQQSNPSYDAQTNHQVLLPATGTYKKVSLPWSAFVQPSTVKSDDTWTINTRQVLSFLFSPVVPSTGGQVQIDVNMFRLSLDTSGGPAVDTSSIAPAAISVPIAIVSSVGTTGFTGQFDLGSTYGVYDLKGIAQRSGSVSGQGAIWAQLNSGVYWLKINTNSNQTTIPFTIP